LDTGIGIGSEADAGFVGHDDDFQRAFGEGIKKGEGEIAGESEGMANALLVKQLKQVSR
jgi:hypothetical protein